MEDEYHNIVDILLKERVDKLIATEGLEGTEDLIKRVLQREGYSKLRERFLKELYRRYK